MGFLRSTFDDLITSPSAGVSFCKKVSAKLNKWLGRGDEALSFRQNSGQSNGLWNDLI